MNTKKSTYEVYRERVKEKAAKLKPAPVKIPQNILWLKSAAIERIETDGIIDDKINTFRVHDGKEITLTESLNVDQSNGSYKFGFTEQYVNLLMHYAYEAGKQSSSDQFKRATKRMDKALIDIAEILSEAGYTTEE